MAPNMATKLRKRIFSLLLIFSLLFSISIWLFDIPIVDFDIDALYVLLWASSSVVILGVFFEEEELIKKFNLKRRNNGLVAVLHEVNTRWFELARTKFGFSLLVIGLAGELILQERIASKEAALTRESNEKIANTENRTAILVGNFGTLDKAVDAQNARIKAAVENLNRGTKDLNGAIDKARISAQEAEKSATEMRGALNEVQSLRVKIHDLVTPRSLTSLQTSQLIEELKQFKGISFDMSAALDKESYDFAKQIGFALKEAGWNWEPRHTFPQLVEKGVPDIGATVISGLKMGACEMNGKTFENPAGKIRDILNRNGFSITGELYKDSEADAKNEKCGNLHIHVGSRL